MFFVFFENTKEIKKNTLELSQFLNSLTQREIISEKAIVYECLQHDIWQKSVTLVVNDLEI